MAILTATDPIDMTEWNFADIDGGSVTGHTSTKYSIAGLDGVHFYQFTGSGLTYNGSNELTGGVVTGYRVLDVDGNTLLSVTGFSMGANALQTAIGNHDSTGAFENTAFKHENTLNGSAFDDVLIGMSDGQETINGGGGNDTIIDDTAGGADFGNNDKLFGGAGDDSFYLGAHWTGANVVGGEGFDTVYFDGNYPLVFSISGNIFTGVEDLVLLGGPNYSMFFDDSIVAAGATLTVDASNLGNSSKLIIDMRAELDGRLELFATGGNDRVGGTKMGDTFWLESGGRDRVQGREGGDIFMMGGKFAANDRINGGDGTDTMRLDGDYSAGITLAANTMKHMDLLSVTAGHSYKVVLDDGNITAGEQMIFVGASLGPSNTLTLDASAESDGSIIAVDGAGNDTLIGSGGDDRFVLSLGGQDVVSGGAGDDQINFNSANFTAAQQIDGGAGVDSLVFETEPAGPVVFTATTLTNVEEILFDDSGDFDFTLNNATVALGATLKIDGTALSSLYSVAIDGSQELNGFLFLTGGAGNDTLIGGSRADTLRGRDSADFLRGGLGDDTYTYGAASESTGSEYDTIDGFDSNHDFFDVAVAVAFIDAAVNAGSLSKTTFDADLAARIDAGHLLGGDAVIFRPNAGTLAGTTFLIIDQNGIAGYQAGADVVVEITNGLHLTSLAGANFF